MTGDLLWPSLWSAAPPPLVLCCTPPPPPPPPCQPGRVRLEVRRSWPRHNTHPGITKQVSSLHTSSPVVYICLSIVTEIRDKIATLQTTTLDFSMAQSDIHCLLKHQPGFKQRSDVRMLNIGLYSCKDSFIWFQQIILVENQSLSLIENHSILAKLTRPPLFHTFQYHNQ